MGTHTLSETKAAYHPPSTMLSFMGPSPTKLDGSLHDGRTDSYFQAYRNNVLSKFSVPYYDWGLQNTEYSAKPNVPAIKMNRIINRDLNIPTNKISTIDSGRMKEVDDLYKIVQMHRSQYKDRTNTIHPLAFFKIDEYEYQCAPGMTTSYFTKYPQNYVDYKIPIVVPLTYERRKQTPYIPDLSLVGIYNKTGCIAYKR
ncbi:ciliary microtubule inner protein 2C-like [Calliopsis andreniformis]|uniref:ciliary microtubule inner protein 2C-like n=1 Tax=Calliopsis andreniformis TaxID=337506 RepID=UPI003FCD446F